MSKIKSACVYCGATKNAPEIYYQAARDLGKLLADSNIKLTYGGGRIGLMGQLAESCLKNGGYVYGVIPKFLDLHEGGYNEINELEYVESMHERKQKMFERADMFIILPGGFGTLDELCEILTWKQIGLHEKYVFIVDINGYWSPIFKAAVERMTQDKFIRDEDRHLFTIVERVEDLKPLLLDLESVDQEHYVNKWG